MIHSLKFSVRNIPGAFDQTNVNRVVQIVIFCVRPLFRPLLKKRRNGVVRICPTAFHRFARGSGFTPVTPPRPKQTAMRQDPTAHYRVRSLLITFLVGMKATVRLGASYD